MEILHTIPDVRAAIRQARRSAIDVGFVPTMGALHEGHLSLIRRARADGGFVSVSIFVNPTQFGPNEDLGRYPRPLEQDIDLARSVGADMLFVPSVEEIYPPGPAVRVEVAELGRPWEGESRPGHFVGVTTVCAKLFNILKPDRAYFGRKDYQQFVILRRMVEDLRMETEVIGLPTVRDADGLALSSRNAYLSSRERQAALALSRALRGAEELYAAGERSAVSLLAALRAPIEAEPLLRPDYIALADAKTLEPAQDLDRPAVALVAAAVGSTRLIDNTLLPPQK